MTFTVRYRLIILCYSRRNGVIQMIENDLGRNEGLTELREKLIIPTVKRIAHDLEQEGWYCIIGNINPFKDNPSLKSPASPELGPSCFTSLLIADIEHRIAQYVYVFLENDNILIMGDESSRVKDLSVPLMRANENLEGAIRKVIDLGI